ncbi:MAG: GntR family transcriptional regulator [Desulfobacterales bacterium]
MSKSDLDKKNHKASLTQKAYSELKERIMTGKFSVGEHYLEPEIAEMLGISRTPAREALIRLSQEGLIDLKPRRGVLVRPIFVNDLKEIYEVLTSLESTAVLLAAKRRLAGKDMQRLKSAVDEMDEALVRGDLDAWAEADVKFHMLLVELGNNNRIRQLVQTYFDQAHRVRMLTLKLRPKPVDSNKDHRAVVEMIEKGNAEEARRIHYEHREKAGVLLLSLLESYGFTQL